MIRNPEIRRSRLMEILKSKRFHEVDEVIGRLDASKATVHRDLDVLESKGLIKKTYGCIEVIGNNDNVFIEYKQRFGRNIEKKKELAREAVKYISGGDTVFLDASSTIYYLAELLFASELEDVTVVSNSVHILSLAQRSPGKMKFISTGGCYDSRINAFLGDLVSEYISNMTFKKVFVSCAGFSEKGITTTNDNILSAIKSALNSAKKRYCLVDSSKYGCDCLLKITDLAAFDAVITDGDMDAKELSRIRRAGINLVTSAVRGSLE